MAVNLTVLNGLVAKFRKGSPNIAAAFDETGKLLTKVDAELWAAVGELSTRVAALEDDTEPPPPPTFKTSVSEGTTMNLPYTWTFTPGDAAAKGQFWANGIMLHEATGPGPYTYVVPKDKLANGTNEVGHSWDTTAGQHVAASPTYHLTVAGSSSPPEPQPGPGTILFEADYSPGDGSEWHGGAGGGGGETNQTTVAFRSYEQRNGEWCCKHTLAPGGSRSEFGRYVADIVQDVDRYWGTEMELPSNHNWNAHAGNGIQLTQHEQSNGVASAPYHINIGHPNRFPRALGVIMMTGTWQAEPVFGTGLEYVTGDTSWAGHTIQNLTVIPTDQVPLGVPIQIILRSFRTGQKTGKVQAWWKKRGEPQTAWRPGSPNPLEKTNAGQGFPTLQHYPGKPYGGHDVYPDTLVCKAGAYAGGNVSATFSYWHYRFVMGTTFEAVAARMR